MEQHVATLLIRHHQVKNFVYNIYFMFYAQCVDVDLLIESKYFVPLNKRLYRLLIPNN